MRMSPYSTNDVRMDFFLGYVSEMEYRLKTVLLSANKFKTSVVLAALFQRLRRWFDIKLTLCQRLVFDLSMKCKAGVCWIDLC